jgi:hypothetical protein
MTLDGFFVGIGGIKKGRTLADAARRSQGTDAEIT